MTTNGNPSAPNALVELSFESFMGLLEHGVPRSGLRVVDVNDVVVASDDHVTSGTESIWNTLREPRYVLTMTSMIGDGLEDNRFLWLGPEGCVSAQTNVTPDTDTPPTFVIQSHPLSSRYTVFLDLADLVPIAGKDFSSGEAVQIEADTWEGLVVEPGEEHKQRRAQQDAAESLRKLSPAMAHDVTEGMYEQTVVASGVHDEGHPPVTTAWLSTPHGYLSFYSQPRKIFGNAHYLEPTEAWVLFMMASHQLPTEQQISTW